jgi:cytochrome c biogenesis protein CcmG/thiol:disulfide interchange protein DsbE
MLEQTQTISQTKRSLSGKQVMLVIGATLLAGWVLVMVVNLRSFESTELQGRKAPEFTLPLFDQFEEDQMSLSELRGQVVVINFWASWCVECYKEAHLLEQAWQEYKEQGVVFIGVDHLDTEKDALIYMQQYGITYPSGPDLGNRIARDYGITGVPETFFIDKDGNIAHVQIGPIDKAQLYSWLEKLVAQPRQET